MALLFSIFAFERQLGAQNPKTLSPKGPKGTSEWGNEKFIKRISS
jgi:hypothetical protein